MSLMKTLAKVAVGVAVAKGVSGMLNKGSNASQNTGGLFGQAAQAQSGGGLEGMLGSLMGGQGSSGGLGGILENLGGAAGASGGLNGVLGQLSGGSGGGLGGMIGQLTSGAGGGLGGLLGQLTGGHQAGGGGFGGALGGLLGGAGAAAATSSFGSLLNQAISRQGEPEEQPDAHQEALAGLMLRAMIQAMKADGEIDKAEQERLLGRLGDVSDEERDFVAAEMKKDSDPEELARDVPDGLQPQIYAMSVMGIDLDSKEEAQYLDRLATAMGMSHADVNQIHEQLGVPSLYT